MELTPLIGHMHSLNCAMYFHAECWLVWLYPLDGAHALFAIDDQVGNLTDSCLGAHDPSSGPCVRPIVDPLLYLLQLLAAVLVTIGTILGIIAWTEFTRVKRLLLAHMVIGLILFGFVVIQVAGALGRPSHKSNLR